MHRISRRTALRLAGSASTVGALSGCIGPFGRTDAGSLEISNRHSERHTVTIAVTKTSDDHDDTGRHDQPPAPEITPIWEREEVFVVKSGNTVRKKGFVTEPGAFYIEAQLENGETATEWLGLYEAVDGGVGSNAIFVDIYEHGAMGVSTIHQD